MSGTPATVIDVRNVTKTYKLFSNISRLVAHQFGLFRLRFWRPAPQFQEFTALDGVSVTIRKGERVGLVGRNGAGKTTLLKLISGNFAPTSGEIHVDGTVQALMQSNLGLHPDFTGYDNICSALTYNGLRGEQMKAALDDVISFVELGEYLHQPMKTYSLGMQARLRFAAATAIDPEILIIDEMLGAGDAYFSVKSSQRVERLTGQGCTLVLVSHSAQQVLQFCDRAIWLEKGRVVADGPAEDIVGRYEESLAQLSAASRREKDAQPDPAGGAVDPDHHLELARRPFTSGKILPQEPVSPDSHTETVRTLASGLRVLAWSAGRGPQISDLSLDVNGKPTTSLQVGGEAALHLTLTPEAAPHGGAPVPGVAEIRIYDVHGELISTARGSVPAAAGVCRITVDLGPVVLGAGQYILSVALFDATQLTGDTAGRVAACVDLLSRCLHFTVQETNDPGPPVVHMPGMWTLGTDAPVPAPINGWA